MARMIREQFDRDRDFTVTRVLTMNGKQIGPGQPFDKTQVSSRTLRQLYDQRSIKMNDVFHGPMDFPLNAPIEKSDFKEPVITEPEVSVDDPVPEPEQLETKTKRVRRVKQTVEDDA